MKTNRREFLARAALVAAFISIGRKPAKAITMECVFACLVLAGGIYVWFKLKGLCDCTINRPQPPPPAVTNAPPPAVTNAPPHKAAALMPTDHPCVELKLNDHPDYWDISSFGYRDENGGLFVAYTEFDVQTFRDVTGEFVTEGTLRCWFSAARCRVCYRDRYIGPISVQEIGTTEQMSFDAGLVNQSSLMVRIAP